LNRDEVNGVAGRFDAAKRFGIRFWRAFVDSQCLMWATSLCYTTLLSIVPLMAVTLAIASAFPVFGKWTERIQSFVFENFVPATSEVIQEHLNQFVERASRMSAIGVVFVLVTAVLMMLSIDGALNAIWGTTRKRTLARRLLSYWTVLTLGPLLMTASVAVTSYVVTLPILAPARATPVAGWVFRVAPFGISTLGFWIVYLIVPNTRVRWSHALWGALVAGALFEVAKGGFAFYVTHAPTYEAVYGAFAAVPVFLVWVYLSWLVTLVGATFAATLAGLGAAAPSGVRSCESLVSAYHLLACLWRAQRTGRGIAADELRAQLPELGADELQRLLTRLARGHFVQEADGAWFLSRDVSDTTLLEMLRSLPVALPDPSRSGLATERSGDATLAKALETLDAGVERAFDHSLREFFEDQEQPSPS
jgi:membrane protein